MFTEHGRSPVGLELAETFCMARRLTALYVLVPLLCCTALAEAGKGRQFKRTWVRDRSPGEAPTILANTPPDTRPLLFVRLVGSNNQGKTFVTVWPSGIGGEFQRQDASGDSVDGFMKPGLQVHVPGTDNQFITSAQAHREKRVLTVAFTPPHRPAGKLPRMYGANLIVYNNQTFAAEIIETFPLHDALEIVRSESFHLSPGARQRLEAEIRSGKQKGTILDYQGSAIDVSVPDSIGMVASAIPLGEWQHVEMGTTRLEILASIEDTSDP
jgi:hypothetical protein